MCRDWVGAQLVRFCRYRTTWEAGDIIDVYTEAVRYPNLPNGDPDRLALAHAGDAGLLGIDLSHGFRAVGSVSRSDRMSVTEKAAAE